MLSGKEFLNNSRNILLLPYLSIVCEHQNAILLLIKNKLYGSASVLVRPIFEIFYRALWICKCASDLEIEEVTQDDNKFPNLEYMAGAIDKNYASDGFFSRIKSKSYGTMSSYIHTGLLPVSRRYTGSILQPNYEPEELKEIINCTTIYMLLLARLVFMSNEILTETKEIEDIIKNLGL